MGTVINFRPAERAAREPVITRTSKSAVVIILPVIRIERYDEAPSLKPEVGSSARRRRRRRTQRS
ncbi:MAG TPA: hypothetical protein VIQ50_01435 [Xanthobacteraceae bacterium]|jgi:hypothetical protein